MTPGLSQLADYAVSRRRRRPPPRTDVQSGGGYRGVGSYDSYGNPIRKDDTLEISYGPQFRHVMGGRLPRRRRHGVPYDFPR